jgi:uncharacterized membrane protein
MGGVDTALLLVGVLACSLVLPLVLGGAAWLGLRTRGRRGREGGGAARALLDRRLAAGEIDVEEYYERESALRSVEPVAPPRRR